MKNFIMKVVMLLSTIVYRADCCSSRILLFNHQSLKMFKEPPAFIDYDLFHKRNEYVESGSTLDFSSDFDLSSSSTSTSTSTSTTTTFDGDGGDDNFSIAATITAAVTDDDDSITSSLSHQQDQQQQQQNILSKQQRNDQGFAAMRNVLSLECEGLFRKEFCLQGRCFRFPIGNQSLYSCECFDGYFGERCEAKSVLGNELVFPTVSTINSQEFKGRPPPKMMNAGISLSFPILIGIAILHNVATGGNLKFFKRRKSLNVQMV